MTDSLSQRLPTALLRKLEEARPCLELSGGSIQRRRRDGIYALRIRTADPDRGRVHRRITLGDKRVSCNTQELIDEWRRGFDDRQAAEERKPEEECQREEESVHAERLKELKAAYVAQASGPGQRRRFARDFDEASEDPTKLYAFAIAGGGYFGLPGRPRPKPRAGLC